MLSALCDSFCRKAVVGNLDNTGNVKRYSDNKEFEIKREWYPEMWAVMGRFSGITGLYLLRFSRIYRGAGALLSGTTNAAGRSAPPIPDNPSPVTYCNSTNTLTPETVTRISTSSNVSRQSRRSVFR